MHYEHTTVALIGLLLGIYLMVDSILVALGGPQWLPGYPSANIGLELFHNLISFGTLIGPILIALGAIGIKREIWVRKLEQQSRM